MKPYFPFYGHSLFKWQFMLSCSDSYFHFEKFKSVENNTNMLLLERCEFYKTVVIGLSPFGVIKQKIME